DEEHLRDLVAVVNAKADHRMTAAFQRLKPRIAFVVLAEAQMHEHAVAAVGIRIAERFPVDGNKSLALLAGGFGEQLFEPGAETCDFARSNERDLVAAEIAREHAERDAKTHARIGRGRNHVRAAFPHTPGVFQQTPNVDADRRGGYETEFRQHREAAADFGVSEENVAELIALRRLLERTAGIGDGDEARTGLAVSFGF